MDKTQRSRSSGPTRPRPAKLSRTPQPVVLTFPDGYERAVAPRDLWRFFSKVRHSDTGCWDWTDSQDRDGYAEFSIGMRTLRAHRFAFRYFVGQLVDGMVIDHLCRNRQCVNPHHMEAVTVRENTLRGEAAPAHNIAKNHCDAGHPFDRINTYLDPRGHRGCRACRAEAAARYQAKRRQAAS